MAGWSTLTDELSLQEVTLTEESSLHEVPLTEESSLHVQTFNSDSKFYFDLDSSVKDCNGDGCNKSLKSLFDQVLLVFLREVYREKCIRPIPALLGDGQPADLFKLFLVIWKRGGHESVSRNGLWALVAKECGLDVGVMASLKLIYMKYLNDLDQWLRTPCMGSGEDEVCGKLGLLLELKKEFKDLLWVEQDVESQCSKLNDLERKINGKCNDLDMDMDMDMDIDKRELFLPAAKDIYAATDNAEKSVHDDHENFCANNDKKVVISETTLANQVSTSQKRKRESLSLSGMLNWVIEVARNSTDPTIGRVPDCSKWKDYSSNELWVQALLAREVLLTRHHVDSNSEESLLQKKMKMHPAMYEDSTVVNHQSTERLRCSERLPSLTQPRFCPCCHPCSATQNKVVIACKPTVENSPKEEALPKGEILGTKGRDGTPNDGLLVRHVSVGPLFQAEVPEWTGVVGESDSKWLGTRMWPPENTKHNPHIEMDPIGKGRRDSCGCQLPGSVRCVRFHIAERRMKLKIEIGPLFYRWRFDRMGEVVSLSWTIEEEKRFKDLVRLKPPSLNKFFWDGIFRFFPPKTNCKIVNYYFNVFIVGRRAYQNRVTPKDIDSDDDESEFGCVGGSYGYETLKVPSSELLSCVENKQWIDL